MGEERKIVVEHYPVERLPEDIRARIGAETFVRVTIETEAVPLEAEQRPLSWYFGKGSGLYKDEDPVAFIRTLRDEWE